MPPTAFDQDGCARCRHEAYWNIAGLIRLGAYEPPLTPLILGLKYAGHERNAELAADRLADAVRARRLQPRFDHVIPVPMHWLRRLQRPCDHADILAVALALRLKLPVLRAAKRTKHTPSQTGMLTKQQRFENVKGCFRIRRWCAAKLRGRCMLLVDNLVATGATVCEVAKALHVAGARKIYVAVIARTAPPGEEEAEAARCELGINAGAATPA